jgi:uncharacterized protein
MTRLLAALVVTLLPVFASAQTPSPPFPDNATLLHLTEQAQRLVTRDRLRLVLRVEAVDADAATLQAEVNRRMTAAVARAKSVAAVMVETGGYSVYQQSAKLSSPQWHGTATLSLTARDPAPLLTLAGGLQQDGLLISTMAYELTPEAARAVESELTDEALTRLKQRAERMATALGLAVERIRDLRIGNAGGVQPVPRMFAENGSPSSSYAAPVAEPGQATVTVSVDADVVLAPRK